MLSKGGLHLAIATPLLGACMSSTGAAPLPTASGAQRETLKVGGQERNYYVLHPPDRKARLPLVLALHGYTQPPQGLEFATKLDGVWRSTELRIHSCRFRAIRLKTSRQRCPR